MPPPSCRQYQSAGTGVGDVVLSGPAVIDTIATCSSSSRAGGVNQSILGANRRAGARKLDRGHGSLDDWLDPPHLKLK